MSTPEPTVMYVAGQHAADRLLASQKLRGGSPYLCGQPAPTPSQVSAVLHALADHTLSAHMVGVASELATDREQFGTSFQQASGMARFFQRMGDWLSYDEENQSRSAAASTTPAPPQIDGEGAPGFSRGGESPPWSTPVSRPN